MQYLEEFVSPSMVCNINMKCRKCIFLHTRYALSTRIRKHYQAGLCYINHNKNQYAIPRSVCNTKHVKQLIPTSMVCNTKHGMQYEQGVMVFFSEKSWFSKKLRKRAQIGPEILFF